MGTHLSMTARHLAVALTLAVGAAGAVALPAWAASHGKSPAQHRTGHAVDALGRRSGPALPLATRQSARRPGPAPPFGTHYRHEGQDGTAVLGAAVKYVRHKDGSIHRVR